MFKHGTFILVSNKSLCGMVCKQYSRQRGSVQAHDWRQDI